MAIDVTPLRDSQAKLTINNEHFLGIHIANTTNPHAAKQFKEDTQNQGYIIKGAEVSNWDSRGLIEYGDAIYLYGPYHEGRTVDEVLISEPKNALYYLHQLAAALLVLKSRSLPLPRFQANGILFLDDGGLLFFPPALMERLRNTQIESERIRTFERYNNTDLETEESLSFSLAILCYRLFTGKEPFEGGNEEEIHNRMREQRLVPPRLLMPEIRSEISNDIASSLAKDRENALSLSEWEQKLAVWNREGVRENIAEDERDRTLELGQKLAKKNESSYRRKVYLTSNARMIAVISVVVVFVGFFAGSMIRNALAPRATTGMGPREVVELFYTSITDLDHMAMEDCVTEKAGRGEVTEATNLFVITRMRVGQEGTAGYYPADEWVEAGRPELRDGYYVYGVSNLEIRALSDIEYMVEYIKWEQKAADYENPDSFAGGSVGYRKVDRVLLREDKKYWVIYSLTRVSEELVEEVK